MQPEPISYRRLLRWAFLVVRTSWPLFLVSLALGVRRSFWVLVRPACRRERHLSHLLWCPWSLTNVPGPVRVAAVGWRQRGDRRTSWRRSRRRVRRQHGRLGDSRPAPDPADGFWYQVKCRVLGPPLVTEQLSSQRLSRPMALGVLSCDGLSSAAYGTEEILYALLPFFGLAAFTLVLPLTLVVLFGVLLVVLSYREVSVSVYARAGGSYVVARENLAPGWRRWPRSRC